MERDARGTTNTCVGMVEAVCSVVAIRRWWYRCRRRGSIMSANCCHHCHDDDQNPLGGNPAYRRVLWIVLAVNAAMFAVEIGAGLAAGSAALQADALDFLGDATNYGLSLFVVGMALRHRAMATLVKGATMGLFGLWVLGVTGWHAVHGTLPSAITMSVVGAAALAANGLVFAMLWAYRHGDANMRSVWICSRNDVLGNLAVLLAALGIFGTGSGWPDIVVAAIMAVLALQGAVIVLRQAASELRKTPRPVSVPAE
jgi:Co/Zn/Cd efflux system component